MTETRYKVLLDGVVVAQDMDIKTATLLVKALFEEYYNDHHLTVSVKEMDRIDEVIPCGP